MRSYLTDLLPDPRVEPLPAWLWRPLLNGVVLPLPSPQSAEKDAPIRLPEGSPLSVYTARMARALAEPVQLTVAYALRYGDPPTPPALAALAIPVGVPVY